MQVSKAELGSLRDSVVLIHEQGWHSSEAPSPSASQIPSPKMALLFQLLRALKSNISCPDNASLNPNFKTYTGNINKAAQFPIHFSTHSRTCHAGVWSPSELNVPKPPPCASETKRCASLWRLAGVCIPPLQDLEQTLCLLEPLKVSITQGTRHTYFLLLC